MYEICFPSWRQVSERLNTNIASGRQIIGALYGVICNNILITYTKQKISTALCEILSYEGQKFDKIEGQDTSNIDGFYVTTSSIYS